MIILTFFMTLFTLVSVNHDIQVATFTIYKGSDQLLLEINMDAEDISDELGIAVNNLSSDVIERYLNEKTTFIVNGYKKRVTVQSIGSDTDHVLIQSIIQGVNKHVETLEISNFCLLSIEDQSNIVSLKFEDVERDFLMNIDRTTIQITL